MTASDNAELLNFSPLMKRFTFNAFMVSGFTPITPGSKLDWFIHRPSGMKGYMLNLTLKGRGVIHHADGQFYCSEDEMLLFPPGVIHHYGRAKESPAWDHLWIYFIPRPGWSDWLRWDRYQGQIGRTALDATASRQMALLFKEVIRWNAAAEPLAEALAMNTLERLILQTFQLQPASNRQNRDPRIQTVCHYINEHLAEETRVEQLARMAFISTSRLAHLFRKEMGTTLSAWREQQRVSRACDLLQQTQLSIAQVARAVGYEDPLYFSRIFSQHRTLSPREYRKKFDQAPLF
ncbi:arabinose operon transcriptional regulator AraC (plasmid) [Erwinia sp. E602]|uniref:arabinose operon transcriptional regulator AraC n=1 Tax=Erwinia sp. E602 TaxID=2675378 RepID=UPI001BAA6BE9|nr:arabinose operon transcriptional regulator AraC [Erwinia sp. E602]QUG73698.1 arabinose operon transcriptional regulator AraC [Erwinia sp. E602]